MDNYVLKVDEPNNSSKSCVFCIIANKDNGSESYIFCIISNKDTRYDGQKYSYQMSCDLLPKQLILSSLHPSTSFNGRLSFISILRRSKSILSLPCKLDHNRQESS